MTALTKPDVRGEVAAPVADSNSFLAFIAEAARDNSVDVSKMERLFEMRERMLIRQAHLDFNEALKAAKKDMPAVFRNKRNTQTNSNYADLSAVSDAMDPIITRHGFGLTFGTDNSPLENHYRITCTLTHDGGHEKEYQADIPIDSAGLKGNQNKTLTHAFGSTMSYGRRYLKMMIFDVKTTDDDGNSAGSDYVTDEQLVDLRTMIENTGSDETKFVAFLKVENLESLPANRFDHAMGALRAAAKARENAK